MISFAYLAQHFRWYPRSRFWVKSLIIAVYSMVHSSPSRFSQLLTLTIFLETNVRNRFNRAIFSWHNVQTTPCVGRHIGSRKQKMGVGLWMDAIDWLLATVTWQLSTIFWRLLSHSCANRNAGTVPSMFHRVLTSFWNTGSYNGSGESSHYERRQNRRLWKIW